MVAPDGRTATLKVSAPLERLQAAIELTVVTAPSGTVYRSVSVVANGATCPSTFNVSAIASTKQQELILAE